jgi:translation initiation factor 3 subunit J
MALLKNVMRLSMTSLKGADAKDISSSVTAIANEKIKAEKEAAAGKKKQGNMVSTLKLGCFMFWLKADLVTSMITDVDTEWNSLAGAKKKQLHIEKGDDDFIPGRGGGYDDPDEYDFMWSGWEGE